jgi:serine/threonine protein kinase/tetratricopeptide (TPR) repeat protein
MAQLNHPNVIAVYDVGTIEDQVFFAMEFVDGATLRDWLKQDTRSWREVLDVYGSAGQGLAAAHDAGLQHRDFKPDNVLVGKDGRVRVLDFGLARAEDDTSGEGQTRTGALRALQAHEATDPDSEGAKRLLSSPLTRDGVVMGTPAYMAPEQHLGGKTDARTDQFSYCVALYEALYGERPFKGKTAAETALAVIDGRVREEPSGSKVPAWLRKVVMRGLSAKSGARWPDMRNLLAALGRDPSKRRKQLAFGGIALLLAGGLSYTAWTKQQQQEQVCVPSEDALAGVWDQARRDEAQRAFVDTGLSYAPDVWQTVSATLDRYTTAYLDQKRDACEAAVVRRDQTDDLMQRRNQCLARRLKEVRALSDSLVHADETIVRKSAQAVAQLPPLSYCADTDALLTSLDPPLTGELAEQVRAIDEALALAKVLDGLGKPKDALAKAEEALAAADAIEHRPSQARARFRLGLQRRGERAGEPARAALLEAARMAQRARDDRLAAEASAGVVYVLGNLLNDFDSALEWADFADASLERIGGDARIRSALETGIGSAHYQAGNASEARSHFERALELCDSLDEPQPEQRSAILNNLASVAFAERNWDEAKQLFGQNLEMRREQLGDRHPEIAGLTQNLGAVLVKQLEFEAALEHFMQAAEIHAEAFGKEDASYAAMLSNMGVVLYRIERYEEAEKAQRDALEIRLRVHGPDHDSVAGSHVNLGSVLAAWGRVDQANKELEQAEAIHRKTLGDEHPRLANVLASQADLYVEIGDYATARPLLEEARAIRLRSHGPDDPRTIAIDGDLALADANTGKQRTGIPALVRSIEQLSEEPEEVADLRYGLARLLWEQGKRDEALAAATKAAAEYEETYAHRMAREARAWIAERQ